MCRHTTKLAGEVHHHALTHHQSLLREEIALHVLGVDNEILQNVLLFSKAQPSMWQARGIASHSERKQPQSRSFSLTMDSTIDGAMLRTFRQSARTFSNTAGLRLCGIVDEPTLPIKGLFEFEDFRALQRQNFVIDAAQSTN